MILNNNIPEGPLSEKWTNYKSQVPLVSPSNKRNIQILVVGTGLAGASASASLVEMGYKVKTFTSSISNYLLVKPFSLPSLALPF